MGDECTFISIIIYLFFAFHGEQCGSKIGSRQIKDRKEKKEKKKKKKKED